MFAIPLGQSVFDAIDIGQRERGIDGYEACGVGGDLGRRSRLDWLCHLDRKFGSVEQHASHQHDKRHGENQKRSMHGYPFLLELQAKCLVQMFSKICCFHIADDFIALALLAIRAEENNSRRSEDAEALQ